ncbi:MAG TPA: hypothetical protein VF516_36860 [Kofleriaceae bacterium]
MILTVIQAEFIAARRVLRIDDGCQEKDPSDGTVYLRGTVRSKLANRSYSIVLTCIGGAGNPGAAAATASAIAKCHPKAVLLMGIAAGIRDKVRIGEVVLSDRVVAYEPAALIQSASGASVQPRPEIDRVPHTMSQDVVSYHTKQSRLRDAFKRAGGVIPAAPAGREDEFRVHVANEIALHSGTIASGEKLLRDPRKLLEVRELQHGKVEVGEMEAAGVVEACRHGAVPWLVIRGISDFGDQFKDDRFHEFASCAAAAVLYDFVAYGLNLSTASSPSPGHDDATALPSATRKRFVSWLGLLISAIGLVCVATVLLTVVWRGHRSSPSPPICEDGIEFVRLPGGTFESGNAAERAPRRQLTVSAFYASRYALPSPMAIGSSCSPPPQMPPIGQWMLAAEFCERQNARLITEAEWEFLAHKSPENLEPGAREFTWDCYFNRSDGGRVPSVNPTLHIDGCFLHTARGLAADNSDIEIRYSNPEDGRSRCVWSNGLDPDGRVYRWLILGPAAWGGPDTPFPEMPKLLSGSPRLGDYSEWRLGNKTGEGRWLAYEPHFENKRSTSGCEPRDRACLNHKYYSADIGCFLFKSANFSGGHAAFLQSYLVVPEMRRVRFSAAADDNFQLWLNGEPIAKYIGPPTCLDEFDEKNEPRVTWSNTDVLELQQGVNRLTAVVGGIGNSWLFSVRIFSENNAPIGEQIFATLDPDDISIALPLNPIKVPPLQ